MIDALARSVRARQSQLNSMAGCAGIVHDLQRQRDLLADKRRLHGFECHRYACEIDQSMRNRNQKYAPLRRKRADKLPRYSDSTPHTTLRPAQTAGRQSLQLDKRAEVFALSRNRHAVKQIISKRASALAGLFDVVSQSMPHDRDPHSLNVFGKNHVASVHQRPSLGCVEQRQARAR